MVFSDAARCGLFYGAAIELADGIVLLQARATADRFLRCIELATLDTKAALAVRALSNKSVSHNYIEFKSSINTLQLALLLRLNCKAVQHYKLLAHTADADPTLFFGGWIEHKISTVGITHFLRLLG